MKYMKVCTDCGNEFETDKLYDNTLVCNKCGSGEIDQFNQYMYEDVTIEDCFVEYFLNKIISKFDADKKAVKFIQEII